MGRPGRNLRGRRSPRKPLADLKAVGLDPYLTKFQVLGKSPDACANKPAWLKETLITTDPIEAARVAGAEANRTPQLPRQRLPKKPTRPM